MKKVLLTATVQSHICQFHKPLAKMLQEHGYEVHVAARNNLAEKNGLTMEYVDKVYDIPFERSPFSLKNIAAYRELKDVINSNEYEVIHTNTPVGSVVTRLIAQKNRKLGKTKVFYTAHGFHFYSGAPLKNWLLYYPIERFLSHWTDVLFTINKEDYARAKKSFHAARTEYIPGVGIDLKRFDFTFSEADKASKRKELGVPEDAFLLMSVGELNKNKNHEVIIKALKLLDDPCIHYCIAGEGPLRDQQLQLAEMLGLKEQVHLLGYRRDVPALYKASDVCCFPSIREGLGLAALEAMACGVPVVAADNRGTRDFVVDGENGFLCAHNDAEAFARRIESLLELSMLRYEIGEQSKKTATNFCVKRVVEKLETIYEI